MGRSHPVVRKNCECCGSAFDGFAQRRFCEGCPQKKRERVEKLCAICSKPFGGPNDNRHLKYKTCSDKCGSEFTRRYHLTESHKARCKEWALSNPEKRRAITRKWKENNQDKVAAYRLKHSPPIPKSSKECQFCGSIYETHQVARQLFCGEACKMAAHDKRICFSGCGLRFRDIRKMRTPRMTCKATTVRRRQRECDRCGRMFFLQHGRQKRCNYRCHYEAWNLNRNKLRRKARQRDKRVQLFSEIQYLQTKENQHEHQPD